MQQDSKPVMSNTVDKHTPGPWYANSGMIYGGSHGATIAVFYTNGGNLQPISEEEKEANMNLCAEAPTLKKENEELKEQIAQSMRLYECQNNTIIKLQERNRVLVEALGKVCLKLQEHQKQDDTILKGYTLAANIKGGTDLLIELTNILQSNQ